MGFRNCQHGTSDFDHLVQPRHQPSKRMLRSNQRLRVTGEALAD
ncbi:MAG: hypothetical protein RLZZ11_753, partial [Cyanobacteriota bacterium]